MERIENKLFQLYGQQSMPVNKGKWEKDSFLTYLIGERKLDSPQNVGELIHNAI